jgi:hypothetical protein
MLGMELVVEAVASVRLTLTDATIFAKLSPKATLLGFQQLAHYVSMLGMQMTPEIAVICKERPALRMLHETGAVSSLLAITLLKRVLLQLEALPVPLKHLCSMGELARSRPVAWAVCHGLVWGSGRCSFSIYKPQSILGILFWEVYLEQAHINQNLFWEEHAAT